MNSPADICRGSGPGAAEASKSGIFELIFTTKEVGQGAGLGMNISDEIDQEQLGDIRLESAGWQATAYRFELPLKREGEA